MVTRYAASLPRDPFKVSRVQQPLRPGKPTAAAFLHRYLEPTVAARRLRPLARRRLRMARPPRVFIRARKPWRRFLRIRLGW